MLSAKDSDGRMTARQILVQSGILFFVSFVPFLMGMMGWVYLTGAVGLGIYFLYTGFQFFKGREKQDARRVLKSSVYYLLGLLLFIFADLMISLVI
jgi:protoheme IX farnesyltransferase